MKPDFSDYSLALVKENKIVFSSEKSGLRPLVECIAACKGKFNDCVLHDKVIGLAAARIVVFSGMITSVLTSLSSIPAEEHLKESNIRIKTDRSVENILAKDRSDICPMEKRAIAAERGDVFFEDLKRLFKII